MTSQQKAILFDLDGTLLPINTDEFIKYYMQKVGEHTRHVMPPDQMLGLIWKGTEAMIKNTDPHKTDEQVFTEHFLGASELKKEDIWPVFDQFYEEIFPTLSDFVNSTPISKQIVEEAVNQGYDLVIATNPLFPESAIRERIRWAGLDDLSFKHVTFYENSHFCKPHIHYYQEISSLLGLEPQQCIMVGNDMQEDMVAKRMGMKTYWVTDFAIDRGKPVYHIDGQGTLADLYMDLKEARGVFSF